MDEPKSLNRKPAVIFLNQQTASSRRYYSILPADRAAFCWIRWWYGPPSLGAASSQTPAWQAWDWASSLHQLCEKTIFLTLYWATLKLPFCYDIRSTRNALTLLQSLLKKNLNFICSTLKKRNQDHWQVSLLFVCLFVWNWVESLQKVLKPEIEWVTMLRDSM